MCFVQSDYSAQLPHLHQSLTVQPVNNRFCFLVSFSSLVFIGFGQTYCKNSFNSTLGKTDFSPTQCLLVITIIICRDEKKYIYMLNIMVKYRRYTLTHIGCHIFNCLCMLTFSLNSYFHFII